MPAFASPSGQVRAESDAWTVGFSGPFRVLTYLGAGDKEIDIDDRSAILNVRIEMSAAGDLELVAEDVTVILDFDFSEHRDKTGQVIKERANILFHGREKGPLVLARSSKEMPVTISPEQPLERKVTVSTGVFSVNGVPKRGLAALPGPNWVDVTLRYTLRPRLRVGPRRVKAKANMQFCIARD